MYGQVFVMQVAVVGIETASRLQEEQSCGCSCIVVYFEWSNVLKVIRKSSVLVVLDPQFAGCNI